MLIAGCLGVPGFSGGERDDPPAEPPGAGGPPATEGEAEPGQDGSPGVDGDPGTEGGGEGDGEGEPELPPPNEGAEGGGGEEPDPPPDCEADEVFDGRDCRLKFRQIDAEYGMTCGLTVSGTVRCWGEGKGRDDERHDVPEGTFERLDLGSDHACVMDDEGRLTCWGNEIQGDRGKVIEDTPSTQFLDFAVGTNTTCAIVPGGFVSCWGSNYQGQAEIDGEGPFESLTAGGQTFCGVREDDTAQCWGWQDWEDHTTKVRYVVAHERVCVLALDDGRLSCFSGRRPQDIVVGLPEGEWDQLSIGREWGCVLDGEGSAKCFTIDDEAFADPFPANNGDFEGIAVGYDHACGLRRDGTVYCWGDNDRGQLDAP